MNNYVKYALTFTAGVVVGGFIVKRFMDKVIYEYETQNDEHVNEDDSNVDDNTIEPNIEKTDEIKPTITKCEPGMDMEDFENKVISDFRKDLRRASDERINYSRISSTIDSETTRYNNMIDNLGYVAPEDADLMASGEYEYNNPPAEQDFTPPFDRSRPYQIPPEEFLSIDDYDSDDFTYYADGYVTDSTGLPLDAESIESSFGFGFESYFGTYADDEIWIRNERLKMDFSIARDIDRFVDVAPPRIKRLAGL